ncbi:MAG: cytidylyltransferase domain-containing protein [Microbacteriaceae bacterium]
MAINKGGVMILAILQARLSSTRLPGKVLMNLHGEPMILRQIERIRQSARIDTLVVATSVDPRDDELELVLQKSGIEVRRGPLDDVVERFRLVVEEFEPDVIVRLTADCPLTDPEVIDAVIDEHLAKQADYSSNTLFPTFPDGLDVECIDAQAFQRLCELPLSEMEREHVTLGMYSRPEDFTLNSVEQQPDLSHLRWTVDVPDDLSFARLVYSLLYDQKPAFRQRDVLELVTNNPALSRTDSEVARNSGLSK